MENLLSKASVIANKDVIDLVLNRLEEDEVIKLIESDDSYKLYDYIFEEMDSALIYYDDQWELLKTYCTPQEANFDEAWRRCEDDIYYALMEAYDELKNEEE